MMTTRTQGLPFALPKYGNAQVQNRFFQEAAGAFLIPMRHYGLQVIEREGGIPVHTESRLYNLEFYVRDGAHFIRIMKALGIRVTHMLYASGGYKCYDYETAETSMCFIQKKTNRATGVVVYTAVLPMRLHAEVLYRGVAQRIPVAKDLMPDCVDDFIQMAMTPSVEEVYDDATLV